MGANEDRVVVEHLCSWRLIICVVQPDQSVSKEGREPAAGVSELFARARLDDFGQIGARLQRGVAGIRNLVLVFASFRGREDGPRHLELTKLSSQRDERIANGFSFGHFIQAVAQREQGVEGNQALGIQHRTNSGGELLLYLLARRLSL